MSGASTDELILAIDQGTTNSKAALIGADGRVVADGSAPVGISSPRPEWVEQDANRLWSSVLEAMAGCFGSIPDAKIAGIALSTQRESVVGWQASTGMPLGPVIGWQDRRTTAWCNQAIDDQGRKLVQSAAVCGSTRCSPLPRCAGYSTICRSRCRWTTYGSGTVDSWLIWQLTGGAGASLRSRQRLSYPALRRRRARLERGLARRLRRPGHRAARRRGVRPRLRRDERRPIGARRHADPGRAGRLARRLVRPWLHRGR